MEAAAAAVGEELDETQRPLALVQWDSAGGAGWKRSAHLAEEGLVGLLPLVQEARAVMELLAWLDLGPLAATEDSPLLLVVRQEEGY